jgi:hypothetical protein
MRLFIWMPYLGPGYVLLLGHEAFRHSNSACLQ